MSSQSYGMKKIKGQLEKAAKEVSERLAQTPTPDGSLYSICTEVATKWEVNAKSLHKKVSRLNEEKEKAHGHNLLTISQESRLVGFILALEHLGVPTTGSMVPFRIFYLLFTILKGI